LESVLKYVVVKIDGEECIFIFPRKVNHDYFAEAMQSIRFGSYSNWSRKLIDGEVVSAGFVTEGVCHGRSESLDIDSRVKLDTELLKAILPSVESNRSK
jgi:hypothetical protein